MYSTRIEMVYMPCPLRPLYYKPLPQQETHSRLSTFITTAVWPDTAPKSLSTLCIHSVIAGIRDPSSLDLCQRCSSPCRTCCFTSSLSRIQPLKCKVELKFVLWRIAPLPCMHSFQACAPCLLTLCYRAPDVGVHFCVIAVQAPRYIGLTLKVHAVLT